VADANRGTVTRHDPVSRSTGSVALPAGDATPRPDSIAYSDLGGAAVWVGDSLSTTVYRVGATGAKPIRTYTVGAVPSAIVAGRGAIWVASERGDAVYQLDPSTGAIRTTFDLRNEGCSAPTSIAVNAAGVWIACSLSHRIIRIKPEGGDTLALPVGGVPASLTAAPDGSIWVTVQPL